MRTTAKTPVKALELIQCRGLPETDTTKQAIERLGVECFALTLDHFHTPSIRRMKEKASVDLHTVLPADPGMFFFCISRSGEVRFRRSNMDIQCPTCGEPWDMVHLLEDEPYEWGLNPVERFELTERRRFAGPDDPAREAAKAAGWEFVGDSLLSFVRCPACPTEAPGILHEMVAQQRRERVVAITSVLDDDLDGLASVLSGMAGQP